MLTDILPDEIKDIAGAREAIRGLLNLVEELAQANGELRKQNQELRDENARLKGKQGRLGRVGCQNQSPQMLAMIKIASNTIKICSKVCLFMPKV